MTVEQILIRLEAINAELHIIRHSEEYMKPNNWYVVISWKDNGSELRVKKEASVFYDALNDAWEEFDRIANRGLPLARLVAPIEHQPKVYAECPRPYEFDDDIPF